MDFFFDAFEVDVGFVCSKAHEAWLFSFLGESYFLFCLGQVSSEFCEFDLHLGFGCGGSFREDFEDEFEPVDVLDFGGFCQVVGLERSEGVVENYFFSLFFLD